jgi:hypothetical protein
LLGLIRHIVPYTILRCHCRDSTPRNDELMTVCLKRFELQVCFAGEPVTFSMVFGYMGGWAGHVEGSPAVAPIINAPPMGSIGG